MAATGGSNSGLGPERTEQEQETDASQRTVEQKQIDLQKAREIADEVRAREAAEQEREQNQERDREAPER
jgi:hypothetical protein